MTSKFFTLEEARATLPTVVELLTAAEDDLRAFREELVAANNSFQGREDEHVWNNPLGEDQVLNAGRLDQQMNRLSSAQRDYLQRLNYWVERVSETGVILRDLQTGLLDFPSRQGQLQYFLCWRTGEPDIEFWHLANDGFVGRKPLAALIEYL